MVKMLSSNIKGWHFRGLDCYGVLRVNVNQATNYYVLLLNWNFLLCARKYLSFNKSREKNNHKWQISQS